MKLSEYKLQIHVMKKQKDDILTGSCDIPSEWPKSDIRRTCRPPGIPVSGRELRAPSEKREREKEREKGAREKKK